MVSEVVEDMFPETTLEARESLRGCLPEDLVDLYQPGDGKKRRTTFAQRLGGALNERKDRRYGSDGIHVRRAGEDPHKKVKAWQVVRDAGSAGLVWAGLEIESGGNDPNSFSNLPPKTPQNPATPQMDDEAEERAAILEYDGGLSREEAEKQARGES